MFLGKQLGQLAYACFSIKTGLAKLPEGASWLHLYGVSVLCGIGFTMSLFIATLAFEQGATDYLMADKLGILIGTLLSAVVGYGILWVFAKEND